MVKVHKSKTEKVDYLLRVVCSLSPRAIEYNKNELAGYLAREVLA